MKASFTNCQHMDFVGKSQQFFKRKVIFFPYYLNTATTQKGFNTQHLHIIIPVSCAVKASTLCRAYHNELLYCRSSSSRMNKRVRFKYQTLFKAFAIQQEVQALHSFLNHLIFNLLYSVTGNFPFPRPSRPLLSTHYSHNQSHHSTQM